MTDVDDAETLKEGKFSLHRKLKPVKQVASAIIPNRFKDREDVDGVDANEDFTAPPAGTTSRASYVPYMAQSIFSLIAAVGSRADFHTRFEESSESESDEDSEEHPGSGLCSGPTISSKLPSRRDGQVVKGEQTQSEDFSLEERGRPDRTGISDQKMLRPLPKLGLRPYKTKGAPWQTRPGWNDEGSGNVLQGRSRSLSPRTVPILSRMLEAQARFRNADRLSQSNESLGQESSQRDSTQPPGTALSLKLMEIFGFGKPEEVLAEYPCSLLQSMLLQGYMYVTEGHVCFYAYLPKRSTVTIKSGYLSKRGKKNPKHTRYWFSLKGDVLSYYSDPSHLYFPSGHVDLRYGISASLIESSSTGKETKNFQVTTDQRSYYFRADSPTSAQEWVKALQTVIFRTHNDGDSVKISFLIRNIIDIEESSMADIAGTLKIRVVESGDTYAIDEYFFTFFESGEDAHSLLTDLINGDAVPRMSSDFECDAQSVNKTRVLQHRCSAVSKGAHRSEDELTGIIRKRSASASQTALRDGTFADSPPVWPQGSYDSFGNSMEQRTESSAVVQSVTDTAESASQILNRNDVFHVPTIHHLRRRRQSEPEADGCRHSDDTARSEPAPAGSLDLAARPGSASQHSASDSDHDHGHLRGHHSSTVTLHEIVKAGAYPLHRAVGLAEYLRNRSKQMSSLLATESMGYLEKVSGMWAGGRRHYGESEGPLPDVLASDLERSKEGSKDGDRFRAHFALPPTERLQATYFAYLHRLLPLYGKIYISQRKLCFRSLIPGTRTKMILPIKDIENVEKEKGFRLRYHGLVVIIRGHEELFFEFSTSDARDDCAVMLHRNLESMRFLMESGLLAQQEQEEAEAAKAEHRTLQAARLGSSKEDGPRAVPDEESSDLRPIFDDPRVSMVEFKPSEPLRITCLTIGSRGDVQPYIALCKGLLAEGHRPKIATHTEFEGWIRKHGIDFAPVEGDPGELMRICVEHGMFTYSFLKEASSKFREWLDKLLSSAWQSCQGSDLLIESPSAMAGVHIAEALRIPYFRAFTMPWTRTRAYPHAFAVPEHRMGGAYNYLTYVMFDHIFWKATAGQINRWRKNELGLKASNLEKMQQNKVPFLYNFSPSVVPPPLDYPDWIRVTGYWFLHEGRDWQPPQKMVEFIQRARADGKKLVYIGFGSIVVSDPPALTRTVIESVLKADVRCILSKGWSDRLGDPASTRPEIPLPPEILQIQAAPHDWLFSQIDAAVHHGGAGTTGASLRAGIPTIIKPFFGDQFFFGTRVEDLGVGIWMRKLNVSVLSKALWEATHSERMIVKARDLGVRIRKEDGVATAIQAMYRDLEYAKSLAQQRSNVSATPFSPTQPAKDAAEYAADHYMDDDSEEWTFIGGEDSDIDIGRRIRDRTLADADSSETHSHSPESG